MTTDGGVRRLIVVRHGRTSWNAEGRFQGHADPPLDDEGEATAAALAGSLGGLGVAVVASSDLRRAVATAGPLARACGVPVTVDPRLREVDVGAWEGLQPAEVANRFPAEWERWKAGGDIRRGGGETLAEAGRRVADALQDLAASIPGTATAVAVGHGLSLRSALQHMGVEGTASFDGPPPHLGNGEWLTVMVEPAGPTRAAS